jgi:hypothetical protein
MTSSVAKVQAPTREEFAERLLKGSVRKSYEPVVDIDWDAALDPDKYYLPPKTISLYGTALWESMSRAQQIELSRQEFVNILSAGIWFENMLNQSLLRDILHKDPTSNATHYALTELGDETRHMVMFGKAIERAGARAVRPRRYQRWAINALPLAFRGSLLWIAALIGEEIFDEARHIQFARDGVRKRVTEMPRFNKFAVANINGVGGLFFRYLFTNPVAYNRAGLDGREARKIARANPHFHEAQRSGFAPLAAFLQEVGMMGPIARRMWKRTKFL